LDEYLAAGLLLRIISTRFLEAHEVGEASRLWIMRCTTSRRRFISPLLHTLEADVWRVPVVLPDVNERQAVIRPGPKLQGVCGNGDPKQLSHLIARNRQVIDQGRGNPESFFVRRQIRVACIFRLCEPECVVLCMVHPILFAITADDYLPLAPYHLAGLLFFERGSHIGRT
jgi:hypothetical protein